MNQTTVLGGLLGLALLGSYLTWTDDGEGDRKATDVVVLRADAAALQRIVWKEERKTITAERTEDPRGTYLQVTEEDRKTSKPAAKEGTDDPLVDGTVDDEEPEPEEEEVTIETTTFTGNEQADQVWEAFTPLYALRELETPSDDELADFGLAEPETTLTVTVGGKETAIELGGEAYGTRDRYVRTGGRVFLLDDATIRPLQFAKTRLVERRLQPLEEKDITRVLVTRPSGDTRDLVQRNADDRTSAYWADAATPEEKDVEAEAWLGKLFRMRVRGYVDDADLPPERTPVAAFEVQGADGSWPVELFEAKDGDAVQYYARAAFLRANVELTRSLAEEAIADLETLFDGVTPEPEEPTEAPVPDDAPMAGPDEE